MFALWRLTSELLGLGVVLAAMNTAFYLAIERVPLATVGAIEFLGPVLLAAIGVRTGLNALAVGGVLVLTDLRLTGAPLGFAFLNCALFVLYLVLGHRIANTGVPGIDQLAAAMLIAAVVATPFCAGAAAPAFLSPVALLAGLGVAICSSVVPHVADQLAMARLRRSTFALMLSLLPAIATLIAGAVLIHQETKEN